MKYILILPYGWFTSYMYKDLIESRVVKTFYLDYPYNSLLLNLVRRVHRSKKIHQFLPLPFQDIWHKLNYKKLSQIINDGDNIILDTGAISVVDIEFLNKLKQSRNNLKMILLITDSMHAHSKHMINAIPKIRKFHWDLILSYDRNDCNEYGFHYLGENIYSKMINVNPGSFKSDIYFIGRNKHGRNDIAIELFNKLKFNDIVCNFVLVDNKKEQKKLEGIKFSYKEIPYEDVISDVLASNCILEILQEGQETQSARYYEAVCYNKKLLTNNPNIMNLSFYNPRYMKYFKTIDDIDFDWVKKREAINYRYNNEFSPIQILDKIESILE